MSDSADHNVFSQCENQKFSCEGILPHFTMVEWAEDFKFCCYVMGGGGLKGTSGLPYVHCLAKKSVRMIWIVLLLLSWWWQDVKVNVVCDELPHVLAICRNVRVDLTVNV
jgi:hypothetical protein